MIPFIIAMSLMTVIFIFGLVVFLITFQKKQNRKNKQYLKALIEEKENTMMSISMEIHDNINQMLSVVRMNMHMLEETAIPANVPMVQHISHVLDVLIFDSQNIAHSLNPQYVKNNGFITSLQEEAKWLNTTNRIKCHVDIEGERKDMPDQTGLMVFRIAQEALHNVLKYAEADSVGVSLHFGPTDFEMRVTDSGKGINLGSETYKKGIGMDSIKQRAKIVNGQVEILSVPGSGTTVILNIPNAYSVPLPAIPAQE